jgi:hypothetical protein
MASVRFLIAYVGQQMLNVSFLSLPPPKNMHVFLPFTSSGTAPCRYSGEPIVCLASAKCLGEFKVRRRPLYKDIEWSSVVWTQHGSQSTGCINRRRVSHTMHGKMRRPPMNSATTSICHVIFLSVCQNLRHAVRVPACP